MSKRAHNDHKYPEANHQPRHMASIRKADSIERQKYYDGLTLEQKIAKLPPEPHAAKQRAKLMAQLEAKNNSQKS